MSVKDSPLKEAVGDALTILGERFDLPVSSLDVLDITYGLSDKGWAKEDVAAATRLMLHGRRFVEERARYKSRLAVGDFTEALSKADPDRADTLRRRRLQDAPELAQLTDGG